MTCLLYTILQLYSLNHQNESNTIITDSNGQQIQIVVPQPKYITETFDFHPNNSKIFTGDDE